MESRSTDDSKARKMSAKLCFHQQQRDRDASSSVVPVNGCTREYWCRTRSLWDQLPEDHDHRKQAMLESERSAADARLRRLRSRFLGVFCHTWFHQCERSPDPRGPTSVSKTVASVMFEAPFPNLRTNSTQTMGFLDSFETVGPKSFAPMGSYLRHKYLVLCGGSFRWLHRVSAHGVLALVALLWRKFSVVA